MEKQNRRTGMDDWQPIETAPKDSTSILGIIKGCQCHCYYFNQTDKQWWIEYADGPGWQPTHWKPMPQFSKITIPPNSSSLLDTLLEERPQEAII